MTSAQIRRAFLDYFTQQGHSEVASSSLVPSDPTLLFTNAGMVQFKDAFLGLEKRAYERATTSQKCMRVSGKHNDLENVGPSPRHHTFFEMLGNFSLGDYFKRDAIKFAYELLTKVYGLPPERLAFTVFHNDEEAYRIWVDEVGVDPRRVARMGPKTNFWQMADTGPCGPTSEVHWDRNPEAGIEGVIPALQAETDRFLELWNLVFMQYNRTQPDERHTGQFDEPLPRPGVDTGMGLERLAAVVQGVASNYESDLFTPIMDAIQEDLRHDDATRAKNMVAYRVIADHGRAMTFLLSDGVLPGNEGRAYVLRMVMRRAMRFGKKMGVQRPFLGDVARAVIAHMGAHYADLQEKQEFIIKAIAQEEERFQAALDKGLAILEGIFAETQRRDSAVIDGADVFLLWDTYGFPIDLTRDVAQERGFTLDDDGFRCAMDEQRKQSQAAGRFKMGDQADAYRAFGFDETKFVGYETLSAGALVVAIVRDGAIVPDARAGDQVQVLLDRTPFYGESGGQVGDSGLIESAQVRATVSDTQKPVPGVYAHHVRVDSGLLRTGDTVRARVDEARRYDTMRNHTATHLLHRALHEILGHHATQRGSLVAPDHLRFDFNHLAAVTRDELEQIEARVNEVILRDLPVHWYVTSKEDATRQGAMALFGEKYGDEVRVVCVADWGDRERCYSRELCGGTHLKSTGEIGAFILLGESSVGAGLRRIEATTGRGARRYARERIDMLGAIAMQLETTTDAVPTKIDALRAERDALRRELQALQRAHAKAGLEELLAGVQTVGDVKVIAAPVNAASVDVLREMSDWLRDKLGSGIVALGAVVDDKPLIIASVTPDLIARGAHAGNIVKQAAQRIGGSGGGRPNMAQAGGKDAGRLGEAMASVPAFVAQSMKK
ncbi:MAG: alanine--tRNA ligase [Chloroflexi bacterium]|nr:alanine--tRNA ligase [Chloroflexota bacterium]